MYATRECYDLTGKCTENVKETIVAHCYDLGCTDGECNDGYTFQMCFKVLFL